MKYYGTNMNELINLTATQMKAGIASKQFSATELTQAHLDQIEAVNPRLNAIVTLTAELALETAQKIDQTPGNGVLQGIPVVHKDLADTAGIRTTYGSPLFKDNIPTTDAIIVERIKKAGGITLGKTNTPEFGAGSQTFNQLFGRTRNPYNKGLTCGGSSGGAAVALATRMIPLADGSDMGGSLRNPAAFCNVAGFRPSPGRVPDQNKNRGWQTLSVHGPMARTVEDIALFMSAIAGYDSRDPISIETPSAQFQDDLSRDFSDIKIAWSRDLGGIPVDERVTAVLQSARPIFETISSVEDNQPDFRDADLVFQTFRAFAFAASFAPLLSDHREHLKETVIWNTEKGIRLTVSDIADAEIKRTALYHRVRRFFEENDYHFLVCPVTQVPPFDVHKEYVTEINGVQMDTYIDWMRSCYTISSLGLPAISVPAGFTPDGLPIGIQIVGRHRDDFGVLQLAYAFQQATNFWRQAPSL